MSWRLSRYLLLRLLRSLLVAATIIFGLIALVDFVEATRDVDEASGLSSLDLFGLTLLKTPSLVEQTLPFIVLFAVIGSLNALNKRSELIATRAAGVSAWQYLRPALMTSLVFGGLWVFVGNPLAADALDHHDTLREAAEGVDRSGDRIWLREGSDTRRAVIMAERFEPTGRRLINVTYFAFDREGGIDRFERRIDANSAQWLPTGHFQLSAVREWVDDEYKDAVETLALPTNLTERDLLERADPQRRAERLPPVWELPSLIAQQSEVGFSTLLPEMKFWRLSALPVLLIGMTLIGACVSMRLSREGGTWCLVLAGAAIGFGVFFSTVFVEAFGEVGMIPPLIAAWTVPILTVLLGTTYLARLEDG